MVKQTQIFTTRFTQADTVRLRLHIENSGMSQTDFLRAAVLDYMQRLEAGAEAPVYDKVANRIDSLTKSNQEAYKASTDRTCAMLARVGIEVHALVQYFASLEGGKELMDDCIAKSRRRISKALEPEELEVKEKMQVKVPVNG